MPVALDHRSFQRTRTFTALDGLRAFAVLWVVIYHCAPSSLGLQYLRLHGDLGVDVFFVLSGFLITTLLLREPPASKGTQLGQFYIRRALRIFPLYYLAVLLYSVAAHAAKRAGSVEDYHDFLPALWFYWSDVYLAFHDGAQPLFVHAWSLAIEEKFYLLWPFVVLLWPRASLPVALGGIAATIGWRAWLLANGASEARVYYAPELRIDALLWGAGLALLLARERTFARLAQLARPQVFWGAVAAGIVVVATATNADGWRYVAVPLLCSIVLTGVLLRPEMPGTRLLRSGLARQIGMVSYGVYVLHPLCLTAASRVLGRFTDGEVDGLWQFALGMPLTMVVAMASYRWFERPFLKLKDRFRGAPAPATAPPVEVPETAVRGNALAER